jgi:hypothetical protein
MTTDAAEEVNFRIVMATGCIPIVAALLEFTPEAC